MFYVFLPSINITNVGFWFYVIILLFVYGFLNSFKGITKGYKIFFDIKKTIPFGIGIALIALILVISLISTKNPSS